jgi:hypothetical protein
VPRLSSSIMSIINLLNGRITPSTRMLLLPCIPYVEKEKTDCSASISKPLAAYVLEHYPALPAYAVYPPLPTDTDQDSYTILIVGNKYNNPNYWSSPPPPSRPNHSDLVGTVDGVPSTNTIPNPPFSRAQSQSLCITLKMAMSS